MNWNRKILLQDLFLLLLLLLPTTIFVSCRDSSLSTAKIQKYVEQEKALEWDTGYELNTALLGSGETIVINYTVLTSSLSSVRFTYYPDKRIIWIPIPPNYTLALGESYTETFKLTSSAVDGHAMLYYTASLTTENQSATVRWGYEIFNGNNIPAIDIITTFAIIATTSAIATLISKRKRQSCNRFLFSFNFFSTK